MEKLRIRKFAGLKSVELEIPPVLGLIGPQASGKSIIAKLLFFFRDIASRLPTAVLSGQESPQYKAECRRRFSGYFPIESTGTSDFAITYVNAGGQVDVTLAVQKGAGRPSLNLEWSSFYDLAFKEFAGRKKHMWDTVGDAEEDALISAKNELRDEIFDYVATSFGPMAQFEQIFIPAGRAFFLQIRGTVFGQLEAGESLDPFMVSFGSRLERSKSFLGSSGFFEKAEYEDLRSISEEILHAHLRRIRQQDYLEFTDGRLVKYAQASSGQQEALPLLLLLAQFVSFGHARGRAVYVEEPEAHLFPSTQKLIVELMAQAFRTRSPKMSLVLTTHSSYILTSVNNLLEAGKLYKRASKKAAERLTRIIPRNRTFSPGEVAFYALEDGKAKSIMDKESGLIEAEMIDQVSDDIAIEFDKLLSEGNEKS